MFASLLAVLKEVLLDGKKWSFGRLFSLPFLVSAWAVATASGINHIVHRDPVWDDVASLGMIGFALFSGSKYLSLKGGTVSPGTAKEVEKVAKDDAPADAA